MTLGNAVFGRNKGWLRFFVDKNKGGGDEDFFPKIWPRYPVNFDWSLKKRARSGPAIG